MQMQSIPTIAKSGMTLVELMIVLVILSVLAALAWPSYQNAVQRSRRADGIAALTEIMQAQERWRANHPSYKSSLSAVDSETAPEPALPGAREVSQDGHYGLTLSAVTASGYTVSATVIAGKPQVADVKCQVMLVEVRGGNIAYKSKSSSAGEVNALPDPCWSK